MAIMQEPAAVDRTELGADDPARELAEQLRALATVDPQLANQLVSELVASVDKATDGAFTARLDPQVRVALGLPAQPLGGG
ncbi:hypothetical protein [Pilimelia columellifera]|uniref:Uncharacterized protein n=1 Tax=Pilimelia columellifera subsp. columellifera TaxID=706583 RepID=A0ABN3N036_9ACTN